MTGYDLKRIISDSETLPWTANNNQIYKSLVQLHDDGWVNRTIEDQVGAPDRHIYQITASGKTALNEWASGKPGLPQAKKAFLHQLMWADSLPLEQIDQLLSQYLEMVQDKLFLIRVQADRRPNMPMRTPREKYIWDMIQNNWITQYEAELKWIRKIRRELKHQADR
jgi:DNA-binding PadR family transcriptional regulator